MEKAIKTPIKAIRAKCKDCCCGDNREIRECTITDCPLYLTAWGTALLLPRKRTIKRAKT